jgi:hypothetical protein
MKLHTACVGKAFSHQARTKERKKTKTEHVLAQFVKLLMEIKSTINQEASSARAKFFLSYGCN